MMYTFTMKISRFIIYIFSELADNLQQEGDVLEWLKRNRFKNMELDLFMYSLMAIVVTFVFYTIFLLFGLKPKEKERSGDEADASNSLSAASNAK
jgi:hypothetical protein